MCVLGSLLQAGGDRVVRGEVLATVSEGDFFQADHAVMFRVLADMHERNRAIDAMTFREELGRRDMLEEVGGLAYVAEILSSVPHYAHGPEYARAVREKARLRSLIKIANDLIRDCYAPAVEEQAVTLARAFADLAAEVASTGTTDPVVSLYEAAAGVLERQHAPAARRVRTLIDSLDKVIGGLAKGKFTIVGADPRVGKSAMIKQVLHSIATGRPARRRANGGEDPAVEPVRCGLVTIEEDRGKVAENRMANTSGIPNHKIAHGDLCPEEWATLADARESYRDLPFFIDDVQSRVADVVAAIERLATKYRCEVVAVDHLHLIVGPSDARSREQEVSKISKALKAAFKRCNVAGLVACQFNRGADARAKPTLKNLRDSGSLEADGDCIMLLYREDVFRYQEEGYQPTNTLEVNIAKNKDGAMGELPLHFDGKTQFVGDPVDPFSRNQDQAAREAEELGIV